MVSGINIDTRSVTVEWFERGETKGKEVELETLLSLNQDLAPVNENGNKINKVKEEKKMKNRFHEFSFNQKKNVKTNFCLHFYVKQKKPHAILYTYISPPPPCTPNLYLMTTALKISFVFLSFWFLHFPFDVSCLFTHTLAYLCW